MKTVLVEVTADDVTTWLDRQSSNNVEVVCAECAVAAAMRRADGREWYVGTMTCWLDPDGARYPLPLRVARAIGSMDAQLFVEPFSFEIQVPEQVPA